MSVQINYKGNFGNNMYQYCFARLLAEYNELNLITEFPHQNILKTATHVLFNNVSNGNTTTIDDNFYHQHRTSNGSSIPKLDKNKNYIISGYFQDADLFNNNESKVKSFFVLPKNEINIKDTLVSVRMGDFIHGGYNSEIIHYEWYNSVLTDMPGMKNFLISNHSSSGNNKVSDVFKSKFLSKIKTEFNEIDSKGIKSDFELHLSYKNIVCSNSTFSWWGSFLGDSENIRTISNFGSFGTEDVKSHGVHINNLWDIKNKSIKSDNKFIDITKIN